MTNIQCVTGSRHERTHARLIDCALDLFESRGFEQTTVAQIAAAAGVTQMTFFRHFPSKELAVLADPYDPVIADAVGARPSEEVALSRAVRGVRHAVAGLSQIESQLLRRRVRIIADSPTLRASSTSLNARTEARIADRLIADGADPLAGRVAAAAVLAALTAALYEWADDDGLRLATAIEVALHTLEGQDG